MASKRMTGKKAPLNTATVESALRDLLYRGAQGTQTDIATELTAHGIHATQSSISRSLKRLRAVKIRNEQGQIVWHLPQNPEVSRSAGAAGELVLDVVTNGWLIVIHTEPGSAARVAYFLDRAEPGGIIGTVAGDDTIFVAPPAGVKIEKILKYIRSSLGK